MKIVIKIFELIVFTLVAERGRNTLSRAMESSIFVLKKAILIINRDRE